MNIPTIDCNSVDIFDNSLAALDVLVAPSVVLFAAVATPMMFCAISELPLAASEMLRRHLVGGRGLLLDRAGDGVADVVDLIDDRCRSARSPRPPPWCRCWIASIFWLMSSVALAVSLASSLTSLATTANPLPASPARAASIVAFSASRLVCWAIDVITLMTLPISTELSPSFATVVFVFSATLTALVATLADSAAFLAISLMLAVISSAAVATVWTFLLTCSDAAETTFACALVSSALELIWVLTAVNSSELLASEVAF